MSPFNQKIGPTISITEGLPVPKPSIQSSKKYTSPNGFEPQGVDTGFDTHV